MTEHEKFIEICDLIEYYIKYNYDWDIYDTEFHNINWARIVDVRETIFTPEFIDKLFNFREKTYWCENASKTVEWLVYNTKDPVQYLYDTLWLWNQ